MNINETVKSLIDNFDALSSLDQCRIVTACQTVAHEAKTEFKKTLCEKILEKLAETSNTLDGAEERRMDKEDFLYYEGKLNAYEDILKIIGEA